MQKEETIIVGKILIALRKQLLLSQEDLADFSPKDQNTISDLEETNIGRNVSQLIMSNMMKFDQQVFDVSIKKVFNKLS